MRVCVCVNQTNNHLDVILCFDLIDVSMLMTMMSLDKHTVSV